MITDLPAPGEAMDGGVQAVSSYLVQELVLNPGIELHVLTFRAGQERVEDHQFAGYVQHLIPFSSFGTLTGFATDQLRLNNCLARIQPDVVHSQGGGHHGILAARSGFPFVTTIHGIQSEEAKYQSTLQKRLRTRLQAWLAKKYCIRNAEHTILISPYVASHYGTNLGGKSYLIPNPVDPRFFDIERREDTNRILFLGRLYALKGIKELILAAAELPRPQQTRIILGGSLADANYVAELRNLAERKNLSKSLTICGILSFTDVLDQLSRCTCLVLPSYQETAPMVIQEAMAAGVPVIASEIGGIPYQVIDKKTGFLIAPGDVGALADRLSILNADSSLRQEMGLAARQKAQSEYRAEIVAKKTFDVYETVVGQTRN